MGNDKKLKILDAECYSCKEIIVPVDQKKEEEGKSAEQAAAGLGSLFG